MDCIVVENDGCRMQRIYGTWLDKLIFFGIDSIKCNSHADNALAKCHHTQRATIMFFHKFWQPPLQIGFANLDNCGGIINNMRMTCSIILLTNIICVSIHHFWSSRTYLEFIASCIASSSFLCLNNILSPPSLPKSENITCLSNLRHYNDDICFAKGNHRSFQSFCHMSNQNDGCRY